MNEDPHPAGEPLFVNLSDDDPAILASVIEAREKLAQFKTAFSARRFCSGVHLVKIPFVDRSDIGQPALVATSTVVAENPKRPIPRLWLGVTSILEDLFFCSVREAPKQLLLTEGPSFVLEEGMVEDWMITHEGIAYGGFSMRVLRDRLGEIDKQRFDEHTGICEFKRDVP